MRKFLKFLIIAVLGCNFVLTISCQTKEKRIASTLEECQTFLDKDDLESASACYQKAILSNPEDAQEISKAGQDAVFKKCLEFKDKKNFASAIICFEGLIELKPTSANVYFNLADSYYDYHEKNFKNNGYRDLDLLNKAEDALKRGLEINSKDAPAYALYGEILKEKGNKEEMINKYKKALELSPKTQVFWVYFAMAQEKFDENEGAIQSYNEALILRPDDTLVLYFLGKLYEKTGEPNKAIELYEKLLKIKPNYDDADERLKSLKEKRDRATPEKTKIKASGN